MGKEIATFDYAELDKDTKGKLLCILREIAQAKKQHAASGMAIGQSIAQAHSLLAVDGRDGRFSEWVESECGFSRSTAYNYMNAWQRFGNCPSLGQFTQEAVYALASPKAPEKAAKEAEKLADKGHKITLDKAKELLDKFREVEAATPRSRKLPSQSDAPPTPAEDEPKPQISGGTTFDTAEIDAVAESDAKSIADKIKAQNSAVESFARSLLAAFDNPPKCPWLDESRLGIARDQIKSACATIRLAKAHSDPCPKCKGDGCSTCRQCGYLPKNSYEAAGGK